MARGPQYSPDGEHEWDGKRWVPARGPRAWHQSSIGEVRRRSVAAQIIFPLVLIVLLVVVPLAIWAAVENDKQSDQQEQRFCEEFDC